MIDIDGIDVTAKKKGMKPGTTYVEIKNKEARRKMAERSKCETKLPFAGKLKKAMNDLHHFMAANMLRRPDEEAVHAAVHPLADLVRDSVQYYTNQVVPPGDNKIDTFELAIKTAALKKTIDILDQGFKAGHFGKESRIFYEEFSFYCAHGINSTAYHGGKDVGERTENGEKKE